MREDSNRSEKEGTITTRMLIDLNTKRSRIKYIRHNSQRNPDTEKNKKKYKKAKPSNRYQHNKLKVPRRTILNTRRKKKNTWKRHQLLLHHRTMNLSLRRGNRKSKKPKN